MPKKGFDAWLEKYPYSAAQILDAMAGRRGRMAGAQVAAFLRAAADLVEAREADAEVALAAEGVKKKRIKTAQPKKKSSKGPIEVTVLPSKGRTEDELDTSAGFKVVLSRGYFGVVEILLKAGPGAVSPGDLRKILETSEGKTVFKSTVRSRVSIINQIFRGGCGEPAIRITKNGYVISEELKLVLIGTALSSPGARLLEKSLAGPNKSAAL